MTSHVPRRAPTIDEVAVRVTQVERAQCRLGSGPVDWAELDFETLRAHLCLDRSNRSVHKEAEVRRTRRRLERVRLDLCSCLMQIHLLMAEAQRETATLEDLSRHAQPLVERRRRLDVGDREHEMVETRYPYRRHLIPPRTPGR
jgi:hypothetical protein